MKKILFIALSVLLAMPMYAQQKKATPKSNTKQSAAKTESKVDEKSVKIYDEEIEPVAQIDEALELARSTGRLVMCQVGGNWCPWCIRFAKFITSDSEIKELVEKNFVYIHVNTSKEHKNVETLKRLGNPGRFGYPVFVLLDHEGQVLHIQNSSYLEQEKSYDRKKVIDFFQNWTMEAIYGEIR